MSIARIKLISTTKVAARDIARQITEIAKKLEIKHKGPIPLPTKHMVIATRKTPAADGSHTFDHWEMRVHKWLVEIDGSDQALRQVMRIPVPDSVQIEITLS